jgi:hypothetical protein
VVRKGWLGALSALTAAALMVPAAASGTSGKITRAFANAEWTLGDIATTVSWSGCADASEPSACAWIPHATIGPGASTSECGSPDRQWPGLGEGVSLAFWGAELRGPGPATHDSPMVPLRGVSEQLLCLFVAERSWPAGTSRVLLLDAAKLAVPPQAVEAGQPPEEELPEEERSEELPAEQPPAEEPPAEERPLEEPPAEKLPELAEMPSELLAGELPKPPTGEIARALANADWTKGSIAGSVAWDGCVRTALARPACSWIPYATIGPVEDRGCASPDRRWSSLGEDVSLAMWGGEAFGAGVHEFDFPGIWLDGPSDRLLCLAAIELTEAGAFWRRLAAAPLTAPPSADLADAKVVPED